MMINAEKEPINSEGRDEAADLLSLAASNPWRLAMISIMSSGRTCARVDADIPMPAATHMLRASMRGLITAGGVIGVTVGACIPVLAALYIFAAALAVAFVHFLK